MHRLDLQSSRSLLGEGVDCLLRATAKFRGINLLDDLEVSSVPHFFNDAAGEHLVGFPGQMSLLLSQFMLVSREVA